MDESINKFRSIYFYFNITEHNNKFELYTYSKLLNGEHTYGTVGNIVREKLRISDIAIDLLYDETIGPFLIDEHRKTYQEINHANPLIKLIHRCKSSIIQDFESFLRTEIDAVEDDCRLVLDEYSSSFITNELQLGIYTFKDLSEVVRNLQHDFDGGDNAIDIELDDITRKTKLVVRSGNVAKKFEEKLSHWDYKHLNESIGQKIINLSIIDEIHLKCDVIDASVVNGIREPICFSFVLHKPSGYKKFHQPETVGYKENK